MTRSFLGDLDNAGEVTVEDGTYDVQVVDARTGDSGKAADMVFMDLKILHGPDQGKVVSVNLFVPHDDAKRGAFFHFRNKIAGFADVVKEAGALPDDEQVAGLADALVGHSFEAELSKQTDGDYAGSQQLDRTRPLREGARPASEPAAAAPAAPAEPAAAPAAAANDDVPF